MSGTSAFFRRKCRVKSEIKTPISTPSKIIVCEFESLRREHDKILSIRVSALPNSFLLRTPFIESIWYVGGCSALYFGSSCFVTDCVVTFLLYKEAGIYKRLHIKTCSQIREVGLVGQFCQFSTLGAVGRDVEFCEVGEVGGVGKVSNYSRIDNLARLVRLAGFSGMAMLAKLARMVKLARLEKLASFSKFAWLATMAVW